MEDIFKQIADQYDGKKTETDTVTFTPEAEASFEIKEEKVEVVETAPIIEDKKEEVKVESTETVDDILGSLGITDDVQTETSTPEVPTQEVSSLNFEEIIKEKTGGAYSSLDDILKKLNENPFASDRIKKLNDLELEGTDIFKVLEYDKLNIENLDPTNESHALDIIKTKLKQDEPDLTERELNFLLKKYAYNEDVDSEDDIEAKKMQAVRDAKKYKTELIDYKNKLSIPKQRPVDPNTAQMQEQVTQLKKQWEDKVNNYLSNYNVEKINVGKTTLDFQVKDDMKKMVANNVVEPNKFWQRYTNPDGTTDLQKLASDQVWIENKEAMIQTVWDQAIATGTKELALRIKNAKTSKGESRPVSTYISVEQQILNQMNGIKK